MKRRTFIASLGGIPTAWPFEGHAQQNVLPIIGFLNAASHEGNYARSHAAFIRGLAEAGYEDRRNVVIEYCWAESHYDRLPVLAAELASRKVNVIVATGTSAVVAAKAATTTIPVVFTTAGDPVELELVTSFSRPGGNLTGATQLSVGLAPKRIELMHEMLPKATDIGLLLNPRALVSSTVAKDVQAAASQLGLRLRILPVADERELVELFARLPQEKIEGDRDWNRCIL